MLPYSLAYLSEMDGTETVISESCSPPDLRNSTIAALLRSVTEYMFPRSLSMTLYTTGQITLSASTSLSQRPLTLTVRSKERNSLTAFGIISPSTMRPSIIARPL